MNQVADFFSKASTASTNDSAAIQMLKTANKELPSESLKMISLIPAELQAPAHEAANLIFEQEFLKLATTALGDSNAAKGPIKSSVMLANSAKMASLSFLGHFVNLPWHLADKELVRRIGEQISATGSSDGVFSKLVGKKAINLFVAAAEEDDQASYMRAVVASVKKSRILHLILDAELIERWRAEEFSEAVQSVGMRGAYVSVASKSEAGQALLNFERFTQLDLQLAETPKSVCLSTSGKIVPIDANGAILFEESKKVAQLPVTANPVSMPSAGSGPSDDMKGRIAQLRDRQASALKRRSP